jgi:eukaryotic-like serine/threonine-protein kinase
MASDDGNARSPRPSFDDDLTAAAVVQSPTPTVAEPGEFSLDDEPMLGEYRVEGKIGEGGMGTVFAAIHPIIDKRVAIKVLNKTLCEDQYSVERFLDEARVVNQIQHPNIVDIFSFGQMPDGRHYFVMELLRGETLRARIARGRLSIDETVAIIKALATSSPTTCSSSTFRASRRA